MLIQTFFIHATTPAGEVDYRPISGGRVASQIRWRLALVSDRLLSTMTTPTLASLLLVNSLTFVPEERPSSDPSTAITAAAVVRRSRTAIRRLNGNFERAGRGLRRHSARWLRWDE